jgi:hypothetical protein
MTDREMLEFAAKAAGLRVVAVAGDRGLWVWDREDEWNPRDDDGDALRLAVRIGMRDYFGIEVQKGCTQCSAFEPWEHCEFEEHGTDPYAATRLAITRAAAEIGKTMP